MTRVLEQFMTVDGPTSLDLDDGFNVSARPDGWVVNVFIALPASHIEYGGPDYLSAEAKAATVYRGSSVIDSMLRVELTLSKLSLLPGAAKSALKAVLTVSSAGEVVLSGVEVVEAINIEKASYEDIGVAGRFKGLPKEWVEEGLRCAQVLFNKRINAEADLSVNEDGLCVFISEEGSRISVPAREIHGHILIQEFMIAVNAALAQFCEVQGLPLIYRRHATMTLEEYMRITPGATEAFEGIEADVLGQKVSQLYGKAAYTLAPGRHEGLDLPCYATFSSPLRRFTDLFNQYVLLAHIRGGELPEFSENRCERLNEAIEARDKGAMAEIAKINSAHMTLRKLKTGEPVTTTGIVQILKRIPWDLPKYQALEHVVSNPTLANPRFWGTLMTHPVSGISKPLSLKLYELFEETAGMASQTQHYLQQVAGKVASVPTDVYSGASLVPLKKYLCRSLGVSYKEFNRKMNALPPQGSLPPVVNFKGKMLELCTQFQWPRPEATFAGAGPSHLPSWEANVEMLVGGETFSACGKSLSKKDAEQLAYQQLYEALSAAGFAVAKPKKAAPIATMSDNHKGQLNVLVQKDNGSVPQYQTTPVSGQTPQFRSLCKFHFAGQHHSFEGDVQPSKKAAEQTAAKVALMALAG